MAGSPVEVIAIVRRNRAMLEGELQSHFYLRETWVNPQGFNTRNQSLPKGEQL